ncbi:hypothetical protein C8F04DRAFT_169971 [Mycena alexandri]|uniref:Uncharacterized protein n=1 Tax=Mycena alexandri TaxID=1745969 RepID=A0AAD6T906_9AGAR|nr:hypothetical protein C8F04DRAFT_169971 [Mycena alexandri]
MISWSATNQLQRLVEIASSPEADLSIEPHWYIRRGEEVKEELMTDGRTRYHLCDVVGWTLFCSVYHDSRHWLSQANHIFSRMGITSNYQSYAIVDTRVFEIQISEVARTPPEGYLFLCPTTDLKNGPNSVCWPDCPAYWSLDSSGLQRLSTEEAEHLGFPTIEFTSIIHTRSWDASVYAGIRQFDKAKGFNPYSQDIARHLGYPLFQILEEQDGRFAHSVRRRMELQQKRVFRR